MFGNYWKASFSVKRLVVTLLVGALLLVSVPGDVSAVGQLSRVAGSNRLQTAIATSQRLFATPDSAGAVILARSDDFADALAAASLAGLAKAPILLTPSGVGIDASVRTEIDRVLPAGKTIFLIGGTRALSSSVESTLRSTYGVERLAGTNRYDTSAKVKSRGDEVRGTAATSAIIASGQNFPDALAASAFAAYSGTPIVLVKKDAVPVESQGVLTSAVASTYIVGGTAALSDGVKQQIESLTGNLSARIFGADRYETAVRVAQFFFATPLALTIATGTDFPDALAGGPLAGSTLLSPTGTPLLLTKKTGAPASLSAYLASVAGSVDDATAGFVLGGTSVITTDTELAIENVL
jgi:putative cell wall-binding protein